MSGPRESTKCPLACQYCRLKKAKCNGATPCGNCIDHKVDCVYPEVFRRPRKRKDKDREVEDRLARMEELLRAATQSNAAGNPPPAAHSSSMASPQKASFSPWRHNSREREVFANTTGSPIATVGSMGSPCQPQPGASQNFPEQNTSLQQESPLCFPQATPCPSRVPFDSLQPEGMVEHVSGHAGPILSQAPVTPPSTTPGEDVGASSVSDSDNDQLGATSYLSICSFPPAVEWVSRQIGAHDFTASARRLSTSVLRSERLNTVIEPTRAPEPERETAFRWTNAYFTKSLDSIFGIIERKSFETKLQNHFKADPSSVADKSWYALRNIVYASGCRISLSEESGPTAFSESRKWSWRYYQNALAVHKDLIFTATNLDSIRALLLMAFYTEAIGSPGLENMLLSNAVRLAQSKSLHLQMPESFKQQNDELLSKQWLWWTIYAYDKHLAFRSGRPTAIDDDYISCPVPIGVSIRGMSTVGADFMSQTIRHAQISSLIAKQLTSAKAMRDSPDEILAKVKDLEDQLIVWRQSLKPNYRMQAPFKHVDLPPGTQWFHVLFMHFSWHASMIATHGVFCYPWNRPDIHNSDRPDIHAQVQKSTEVVAEAARQIILGVQRLKITAALPVWLTFYYPMVGFINLFIYILKNPLGPKVALDLSLMDIVVGHFGYLEFISSSELVFPFAREITSYARKFVENAKTKTIPDHTVTTEPRGNTPDELTDRREIPCLNDLASHFLCRLRIWKTDLLDWKTGAYFFHLCHRFHHL